MNTLTSPEDQLRFFAVKVNSGSGCIFDVASADGTYILTAAHNIPNEKEVCVFRFLDQKSPLQVLRVHTHPRVDLAIIVVEKINDGIYRCGTGIPTLGERLIVYGYPERLANEREMREEVITECGFIHEDKQGFELKAENALSTFSEDAAANVIGMSGSGVFSFADGRLILKGIFYELKDQNGANNKLNALLLTGFEHFKLPTTFLDSRGKLNPYKGVDRFGNEDWPYYFGREREIGKMLRTLRESRFAAIVGASGSGKSSLVRAGLTKGLKQFRSSFPGYTDVIQLDVSNAPASNLVLLFKDFGVIINEQPLERLNSEQLLRHFIESPRGSASIIVIDQFERIVNRGIPDIEVNKFFELLLTAIHLEIPLVIAARIDYYALLTAIKDLGRIIANNTIAVFALTEEDLFDVINSPAQKNNCLVELSLSHQLVSDTHKQNNALVLLELALYHIWETDVHKGILTKETFLQQSTYDDLFSGKTFSGILGILVRLAEEKYLELSTSEKLKVPYIFISLLTTYRDETKLSALNISTKKAFTKDFDPESKLVAQKMSDSFLLTSGYDEALQEETVEIGHEALLIHWPRLKSWVAEYETIILWLTERFNPNYELYKKGNRWHHLSWSSYKEGIRWSKKFPSFFSLESSRFLKKSRNYYRKILCASVLFLLGAIAVLAVFIKSREKEIFAKANDNLQKGLLAIGEKDYNTALGFLNKSLQFHANGDIKENFLVAKMLSFNNTSNKLPGNFCGISDDGKLAILRKEGKLVVWDNELNKDNGIFNAEGGTVTKARFSASGNMVAIGTETGELQLLSIGSKRQIFIPNTDTSSISSIAISPDEKWIAWANEIDEIHISEIGKPNSITKLYKGTSPTWAMNFSPDSKTLVAAGGERKLLVFSNEGKWVEKFKVDAGDDVINAITINHQGSIIAAGTADGSVGLFNIIDGNQLYVVAGHKSEVADLKFSPSDVYLLSAGEDDAIKLWNVYPFAEVAKIQKKGLEPYRIAFCQRENEFRVGYKDSSMVTWKANQSIYRTITDGFSPMYCVAVDPAGKWLATGTSSRSIFKPSFVATNTLKIWNAESGRVTTSISNLNRGRIVSIAVSEDSRLLASGCENGQVIIYSTSTWEAVDSLKYPEEICVVRFDRQGTLYVGGRQNDDEVSPIYFYDYLTHHIDSALHKGGSVFDISLNRGDTFVTGGGDHTIRLWSRSQKREIFRFPKESRSVWAVSLSPDGNSIAAGFLNRTMKILNTRTRKVVEEFREHEGGILTVAFSPTGNLVASAGYDHSVRIKNLTNGQSIALRNNKYPIWSLQFSLDGNTLYTCSMGGEISVYNLPEIIKFLN